ncbi:MAG: hypothetical protein A3J60_02105 [Candidatus Pacebacteria bacterium RIFCSPHIGHO2_02_FULL_46_9]|nr:MAG: hypothetical protein A3J60_02105 [Candidatus Pacebacteria bacterium RIFCSPHIGHO2_02_FULL_46_9]
MPPFDFASLITLLQDHYILYVPAIFLGKILGLIIPIIPGGIFTLSAVPVIGWLPAYSIDLAGSVVAANIAYSISGRYGIRVVKKLFGQKITDKLSSIRVRPNRTVETACILRLAGVSLLSDALIWCAPLLKLPRWRFLLGYHLAHLVTTAPLFFLTERAISVNQAGYLLPIALSALILLFFLKGRYFE